MSRLPVIIPVFNGLPMVAECITKLIVNTAAAIHLVIVDNGSDEDPTPLRCLADPHGVPMDILRNPAGTSIYTALNQGLAVLDADISAICCSDVFVQPQWVIPCTQLLASQEDVVWVSPEEKTGPYEWRTGWTALQAGLVPQYEVVNEFKSSVALLHWKKIKDAVGGFDETMDLCFGDTDLLERLNDKGLRAAWIKGVYAQHLGSQSRKLTGVATDTAREIADAQRFVAKWRHRPDVLARHPGVDLYHAGNAAQLRAMKAARWEQP